MASQPIASATDVTTMRRNAEFVRRILESNQDCIKVVSLAGRLLYMNNSGQELMEIDQFEAAVKGEPWLAFWQGEDQAEATAAFEAALAGKTGQFEGFCATAKGTPKWWEVIVTPMYGEDETVQEILSVSRDITSRKNAELALQKRNEELDAFAYIVSHDLKAPLRGIANLASFLEEDLNDKLDDQTRHQLQLMGDRIQRMNAMVNGLLHYSRAGRQELPSEPVPLATLLAEVVDSLDLPEGFEVQYGLELQEINAKRLLLTQVLANLIGNAVKHHDQATGQITVHVAQHSDHLEISIADDGPGIPEADCDRVFGMFKTAQSGGASTQAASSSGMGLAIVQKIMTAEGGKVWVEARHPRGCKFVTLWPMP